VAWPPLTIKTGKVAKQLMQLFGYNTEKQWCKLLLFQNQKRTRMLISFPLMVEFEEKLYAAGIIKGSRWIKREGRPSDQAVLTGRMIDRSIRPLFDQDDNRDIQVIISVLAIDQENDYDVVSLVAASAALSISGVNWQGPIGGVRVGRIENDNFVFNPTYEQQALSDLDLIVAGTKQNYHD
jgi:polyribonucleotide nucleotidyltransferase